MLRQTEFHRVLHRRHLFLGGEREPALMTAILCGGLALTGMNVVSIAIGAAVWFASIPLLRWMAKSDPQMVGVYVRHLRYAPYYPPRSRPWRIERSRPCWR